MLHIPIEENKIDLKCKKTNGINVWTWKYKIFQETRTLQCNTVFLALISDSWSRTFVAERKLKSHVIRLPCLFVKLT